MFSRLLPHVVERQCIPAPLDSSSGGGRFYDGEVLGISSECIYAIYVLTSCYVIWLSSLFTQANHNPL